MEINGAKMFVKALQEEGVDTLFAYPGGTAIDLFDALYDAEGIDMILPRHEQALVHAADGYARSTGRVGVSGNKWSGCDKPCNGNCHSQLRQRATGMLYRTGSNEPYWK